MEAASEKAGGGMNLLELLKRIEWNGMVDHGTGGCPSCYNEGYANDEKSQHRGDCQLKAAIDALEAGRIRVAEQ